MAWAEQHPISSAACDADALALRVLLNTAPPVPREALDALDGEGRAALHYAASNGLVEPTLALLAAGASVDVLSGDRRSTPLHLACGMNHAAVARALLRGGAWPGARDVDAWTPLDLAKQDLFRNPAAVVEVLRVLAERGDLDTGLPPLVYSRASVDARAHAAALPVGETAVDSARRECSHVGQAAQRGGGVACGCCGDATRGHARDVLCAQRE